MPELRTRPTSPGSLPASSGAHANVGGGCQSDPLPQAPLKWLMDKAGGLCLTFRRDLAPDAAPSCCERRSRADALHG